MKPKPPEKRSPLKNKPLRHPGQALDEEIAKIFHEEVLTWFLGAVMGLWFAFHEWWRWRFQAPPNPLAMGIVAAGFVAYSSFRITRGARRLRQLQLGRDGEKLVGQQLEELRAGGCVILHDIPGPGFNLDHLILSPCGLFVVETKTLRKRPGDARIIYDGSRLLIDGQEPLSDYLGQAAAQREWLRQLLVEWTGRQFRIRSILVFPGWYVEPMGDERRKDVWVLNPKAIQGFLDHEPACLSPEEVAMLAARLRMYVEAQSSTGVV